jgi:TPR repeat protein
VHTKTVIAADMSSRACGAICAQGRKCAVSLLALVALFMISQARADFRQAMDQYQAGHYEQARAEFLGLAGLGDGASQYNLAAMSLEGQGGPKDRAAGVGWLQASRENGYEGISAKALDAMRAKLTDEQRKVADEVVAEYGHAALLARVLPNLDSHCSQDIGPRGTTLAAPPDFWTLREGMVVLTLTVAADGTTRDPECLDVSPELALGSDCEYVAVTQVLRSRWIPAQRNGVAVEARTTLSHTTDAGEVSPQVKKATQRAIAAAEKGDIDAEYLVALAVMYPSLDISPKKAQDMLLLSAQGGNPSAQYLIASHIAECGRSERELPWLRQAAAHGNGAAAVRLAEFILQPHPGTEAIAEARGLLEQAAKSFNYYALKHAAGLLAASDIDGLRNPAAARVAADKLYRYRRTDADPQLSEAIAAAAAANGNFALASGRQRAALAPARALHWNTQRIEERLAAYNAGRVWLGDIFAVPENTSQQ